MDPIIFNHVKSVNEKNGWDTSIDGIIETIVNSEPLYEERISRHRWWDEYFVVVNVDGLLIGFETAYSTGDHSPFEMGYEFNPETICLVEKKEKVVTVYEKAFKR